LSRITLIGVPFHLGVRGVGMGSGPLELLAAGGVPDRLRGAGHDVAVQLVDDPTEDNEVGRIFAINRKLARAVGAARETERTPLVVAGNCNVCLGAIGGIGAARRGIVWLDAHPDFHTPETTDSGFLDGMGLAMATGGCWTTLASSIPGFRAVDERDAVLVGVREIDAGERDRLDRGEVTVIPAGRGPGTIPAEEVGRAIEALAARVDGVYLHLDFDSIDPSHGRANEYAVDGGLSVEDARAAITAVAEQVPILATSFTAYNPDVDRDRFGPTALDVVDFSVEASVARD
jgi:arginase